MSTETSKKYLPQRDVDRFERLTLDDRWDIAKELDASETHVRNVLEGRANILTEMAQLIITSARKRLNGK